MDKINTKERNRRVSQSEMPRFGLKEVIELAKCLRDNFAGEGATNINLATAFGRSPASSGWRILTGSAVAYGITDGAYNSSSISLTPLGRRIVMPVNESDDSAGIIEAALKPSILRNFYDKYDGNKLPKEDIAKNVLVNYGVPFDRSEESYKIATDNAEFIGALTHVGDGAFLQLSNISTVAVKNSSDDLKTNASDQVSQIKPLNINPLISVGGYTPFSIGEGKLILQMPARFKDEILDTDDEELETDWKSARKALKKLASHIKGSEEKLVTE